MIHKMQIREDESQLKQKKEKMPRKWTEYIGELYHDNRGQKAIMHKNIEGRIVLKSEISPDEEK